MIFLETGFVLDADTYSHLSPTNLVSYKTLAIILQLGSPKPDLGIWESSSNTYSYKYLSTIYSLY